MPKKDINQTAFAVMQLATGEVARESEAAPRSYTISDAALNARAKGGRARAVTLNKDERAAIAKKAASARKAIAKKQPNEGVSAEPQVLEPKAKRRIAF
jgi:hypothetical protein